MAKRRQKVDASNLFDNINDNRPRFKGITGVVSFSPKNLTQAKLLKELNNENNHIVLAVGAAGTGKSYMVAKYAIQQLVNGKIDRIFITRPTVAAGESLGHLPGEIAEKMEPWLLPIYDVFMEQEGLTKNEIKNLIAKGIIEIAPFQFMRGRSVRNAIVIADEMQNSDPNQFKMLLTRIGEGSQILITGDLEQSDKTWRDRENGLFDFLQKIKKYDGDTKGISVVEFTRNDILRHPIIDKVLDIYDI